MIEYLKQRGFSNFYFHYFSLLSKIVLTRFDQKRRDLIERWIVNRCPLYGTPIPDISKINSFLYFSSTQQNRPNKVTKSTSQFPPYTTNGHHFPSAGHPLRRRHNHNSLRTAAGDGSDWHDDDGGERPAAVVEGCFRPLPPLIIDDGSPRGVSSRRLGPVGDVGRERAEAAGFIRRSLFR